MILARIWSLMDVFYYQTDTVAFDITFYFFVALNISGWIEFFNSEPIEAAGGFKTFHYSIQSWDSVYQTDPHVFCTSHQFYQNSTMWGLRVWKKGIYWDLLTSCTSFLTGLFGLIGISTEAKWLTLKPMGFILLSN